MVIRFDPREAEREAADGRDDLASARGKIDKARADGGKTQEEPLPRAGPRPPGAGPRPHLRAEGREPLLAPSDRRVDARPRPPGEEEQAPPRSGWRRATSSARPGWPWARSSGQGGPCACIRPSKSLGALTVKAPHDGLFVLESGLERGNGARGRHPLARAEGGGDPRPPASSRRGSSPSRPTPPASRTGPGRPPDHRGPSGEVHVVKVAACSRWPGPATGARR